MSDVTIVRPTVIVGLTAGASPNVVTGAPASSVTVAVAASGVDVHPSVAAAVALDIGVPAVVNGPGPASAAPVIAVCDAVLPAGTPLTVSRATGYLVKADAASKPTAFVAGLSDAPTAIGFPASAIRGLLTLADWTAITGSASLAQGQTYFLAAGGGLTTIPPSSPNCLVVVGTAASSTTMLIAPQGPVQL